MLHNRKKNTHPKYKKILIQLVNGDEFETKSTYKGEILKLEIDPSVHPAWTKKRSLAIQTNNKVKNFNKKYSKFGLFY